MAGIGIVMAGNHHLQLQDADGTTKAPEVEGLTEMTFAKSG
jgi:hypothetical protein